MAASLDRLRALAERLRAGARRDAIPLADVAPLERAARRTRVVRLALAAALVATVLAVFVLTPSAQGRRFLPSNTVGIVVLDVSSSVQPSTYELIRRALVSLAATDQRFGVVLFSDVAYQALPMGTPASELRPFIRFFEPGPPPLDETGFPLARTPWEEWFSAGTAISRGLLLAADLLERAHVENGGVVLISDLADDPSDLPRLADTLVLYQERRIPLRIVALDPVPENRDFFIDLLGSSGTIFNVTLPRGERGRGELAVESPFPAWAAVVGGLIVALLALNEYLAEPLRWARRRPA